MLDVSKCVFIICLSSRWRTPETRDHSYMVNRTAAKANRRATVAFSLSRDAFVVHGFFIRMTDTQF